jgi:hypothetical protein
MPDKGFEPMPTELQDFYDLRIVDKTPPDGVLKYQMFACFDEGNRSNDRLDHACLEYVRSGPPPKRTPKCPVHQSTVKMHWLGDAYELPDGELVRVRKH